MPLPLPEDWRVGCAGEFCQFCRQTAALLEVVRELVALREHVMGGGMRNACAAARHDSRALRAQR